MKKKGTLAKAKKVIIYNLSFKNRHKKVKNKKKQKKLLNKIAKKNLYNKRYANS